MTIRVDMQEFLKFYDMYVTDFRNMGEKLVELTRRLPKSKSKIINELYQDIKFSIDCSTYNYYAVIGLHKNLKNCLTKNRIKLTILIKIF